MSAIKGSYKFIYHKLQNEYWVNEHLIDENIYTIYPNWHNATVLFFWAFRCEGTSPIIIEDDERFVDDYVENMRYEFIDFFDRSAHSESYIWNNINHLKE